MILAGFSLFIIFLLVIGMPVAFTLSVAGILGIIQFVDVSFLSQVPVIAYKTLDSYVLTSVPLYILMSQIMLTGRVGSGLFELGSKWMGHLPGGLGIATIFACAIFAAISGSSVATAVTIGAMAIPEMLKRGYDRKLVVGSVAAGGTLGILIPPSNPMIIYAILGNLSVTAMFTAGFIPGFIVAFAMIMTAYLLAKRNGFKGDENAAPFNMKFFLRSCGNAGFALATPFIILGSIYTGWATPVEASVVAIVWALFVGIVINRVLRPRHIYRALLEGAMTCGAVLLIVGASTLFGKILTFEEAPQRLASIVLGISDDPHLVLLMIIGVLYVLGMFMETLATIIILVPVLLPMILQLGIDPIHFGIVLVVTNNVAMLTPPLGVNLFVASRIAGISVERISVAVIPYLIALTLCILLFTYVPAISTWLPSLMGYGQ